MTDLYNHLDPLIHQRSSHRRKKQIRPVFVWPRDKTDTNRLPYSWGRFKDIFSNKGPGMWVGDHRKGTPHRPTWSQWLEFDNLGWPDKDERKGWDPVYGPLEVKYDFRTRRYKVPDRNTWSDARWETGCHSSRHAMYCRTADGLEVSRHGTGYLNNPFRNKKTWNFRWGEDWLPIEVYFKN
ncbi:MAG: hypothetical protein MMC33_001970 [Icmadophila ericetorum]|nr:hypothetical protein [Icmadophila ericetorum]